jgi:hypothetical protein
MLRAPLPAPQACMTNGTPQYRRRSGLLSHVRQFLVLRHRNGRNFPTMGCSRPILVMGRLCEVLLKWRDGLSGELCCDATG